MSYFVELDPSEITAILADGKLHGVYASALAEFKESGRQNAVISLTEGIFAGKTAATVRQSFIQNAEKMDLPITVHAREKKNDKGETVEGFVVLSLNGAVSA